MNLRFAYSFCVLALAGAARADGNLPVAKKVRGGEHPGFRAWVRAVAKEKGASIDRWWSGDLDGDGEADDVAALCVPGTRDEGHTEAILVEDARGRRFDAERAVDDFFTNGCSAPSGEPAFEASTRTRVTYDDGERREHDETDLALRGGALVAVAHRYSMWHLGQYDDEQDDDWERLAHHDEHSVGVARPERGPDGYDWTRERTRDEAIVLVTRGADVTSRASVLVRGKEAWRGPDDASFTVAASQPDDRHLAVDVKVGDDVRVPRGDALTVWIGAHVVELRLSAEGTWFVAKAPGTPVDELTVHGGADEARLTFPAAWAEFHIAHRPADVLDVEWGKARTPRIDDERSFVGSLVVAYSDVDAPHGPVRSVVATAPMPSERTAPGGSVPRGLLVKLPHGARWPASWAPLPAAK